MLYEFRCAQCFAYETQTQYAPIGATIDYPCPLCGGLLKRVVSNFGFQRSMPEHFNESLGRHIRNERHFNDELKRKSEEMSIRTGQYHNYVPVDIHDKESLGVTEDGMEQIERKNALQERESTPLPVGQTPEDRSRVGAWETFDEERLASDAKEEG